MIDISTRRRGRRVSHLLGAPVGVVALVGLAACGTSTDTGTSAASSGAAPTSAPSAAHGRADRRTRRWRRTRAVSRRTV